MRALIVFLLVAVSFALVVMFYPDSGEVVGASPGGLRPVEDSQPRDLGLSQGAEPVTRGFLARERSGGAVTEGTSPAEGGEIPAWLAGVEIPDAPIREGEVRLAEALLHGGPEAVAQALPAAELSKDRETMVRSFSLAIAGDGRSALRLAGTLVDTAISPLERALLQEMLGGAEAASGVTRSEWRHGGIEQAMGMATALRRASKYLEERRHAESARLISDLLLSELEAPWEANRDSLARWSELLKEAQRENRWSPDGGWPAEEITVEAGDSAISIRKRFLTIHPGSLMCSGLILRSNAVRGYLQPGQVLRVPTAKASVLVDLSARWALYLLGGEVAGSWPVGVGRQGEETRTGVFRAGNKLENPPWMKVGQQPVPFGDPENPLGTRWIGWFDGERPTSFGFHGTWKPESIGQGSSDGCIRFHNEDVEELFEILPEGSPLHVRP